MDPGANYQEQQSLWGSKDASDKERVRELVAALREWVQRGGFRPRGYMGPKWRPAKLSPHDKRILKLRTFSAWTSHARWLLAVEREYGKRPDDWPRWAIEHSVAHVTAELSPDDAQHYRSLWEGRGR